MTCTPAPWEAEYEETQHAWMVVHRADGDTWFIAQVADGAFGGDSRSNAHLLAAAPDMLAALQDAQLSLESYVKRYDQQWNGSATPESALGRVRAAIAKATESK